MQEKRNAEPVSRKGNTREEKRVGSHGIGKQKQIEKLRAGAAQLQGSGGSSDQGLQSWKAAYAIS